VRPRHLLLLGGGHAHLHVLRDLATARPPGIRITLVSPSAALTYSGMVPGIVAGGYRADEARIALEPLARRAGIDCVSGAAIAIDAARRRVTVAHDDGPDEVVDYDLLSVDVGGAMRRDTIPGAAEHALWVRPIERFLDALESRLGAAASGVVAYRRSSASAGLTAAVVIGGGAGGFELALALRARLPVAAAVALVSGGPLLASHSAALRGRARRALERRDVALHEDTCTGIAPDRVVLADGASIACDLAVVATGSEAPAWLRTSGLALDRAGFIATGPTLQSLSHGEVFAAGDVATRADARRPRNGVHAVRAGPPLARNLRLAIDGRPCRPYRQQRRSLSLLACGDGVAIAEWGRWAIAGRAIGRLKDRIDRDFVALNRAA
jgi:pyridine nucleotide-disulfide oxidoreductase family protein